MCLSLRFVGIVLTPDIYTQEVLNRTHELVPPPPQNVTPPLRDITSIVDKMKSHETIKQERRLMQMKSARERSRKKKEQEDAAQTQIEGEAQPQEAGPVDGEEESTGIKRKHDEVSGESTLEEPVAESDPSKRPRVESDSAAPEQASEDARVQADPQRTWTEPSTKIDQVVITKPSPEMRGHTSYLTFALFYPAKVRQQLAEQEIVDSNTGTPKRVVDVVEGNVESQSKESNLSNEIAEVHAATGMTAEEEMIALGA